MKVFYASGSKGREVRADGEGGVLARGYYVRDDYGRAGPFRSEAGALRAAKERQEEITRQFDQILDAAH